MQNSLTEWMSSQMVVGSLKKGDFSSLMDWFLGSWLSPSSLQLFSSRNGPFQALVYKLICRHVPTGKGFMMSSSCHTKPSAAELTSANKQNGWMEL